LRLGRSVWKIYHRAEWDLPFLSAVVALEGRASARSYSNISGVASGNIATAGRQFPIAARVDIQSALEDLLRNRSGTKLLGILSPNPHEPPALAHTLGGGHFPLDAGPLQRDEIDVGEPVPVRCLKNGLWLRRQENRL
jgi:hypothetical protein